MKKTLLIIVLGLLQVLDVAFTIHAEANGHLELNPFIATIAARLGW